MRLPAFTRRQRRARLRAQPFPAEWLGFLQQNVTVYGLLGDDEQARLRDYLRWLVVEMRWEGCGGLVMTDEIKVTIAAQAALLLLGLDPDSFRRVQSVLVYPSVYRYPSRRCSASGVIAENTPHAGEAHYHGPVVLAWDLSLENSRDPVYGKSLVLHEFAHQLDFLDGWSDGQPWLEGRIPAGRWKSVMKAELDRRQSESRAGYPDVLGDYAATDLAEFFAVATECFFMRPSELRAAHWELYELLREYYRQDPADRLARASWARAAATSKGGGDRE